MGARLSSVLRSVVFDFGQTLVDSSQGFRAAERTAQQRLLTVLPDVDPQDFMARYRTTRSGFKNASSFSRCELWRTVLSMWNAEAAAAVLKAWEQDYWETVMTLTQPFPETVTVLRQLQQRYRLAVITNTQGEYAPGTHRIGRIPELRGFFEAIIVAGEQGVPPKPSCRSFEACLNELNVSADEAVYVGDDWDMDIKGARDCGMHAIWLQHHTVTRNWPVVHEKVPVITSLDELLRLPELLV